MSQESHRGLPDRMNKSPSRIPRPAATPISRKRTANMMTPSSAPSGTAPTRTSPRNLQTKSPNPIMSGYQRLQAMAKADAKNKSTKSNKIGGGLAPPSHKNVMPWVDKHIPKSLDELFVHKKKVEEMMNWLNKVIKSRTELSVNKICVLSGPAGCGKTATLQLAANALDVDVKEWVNPVSLTDYQPKTDGFRGDFEIQGPSQLEAFADFLLRTSQYKSLPIMKGKANKGSWLVLVEDVPNALYRDPNVFHELLRKYMKFGRVPLVFIFTDATSSEHSLYKMVPKTLATELNVQNISFNLVAASLMTKFLLEICSRESISVDRSQIDEISATSNGDLRCAVNNLQFFLTKERTNAVSTKSDFRRPAKKAPPRNKKDQKQTGESSSSGVQQKDETIQLFRALGKVLYGKRNEAIVSEVELQLQGDMESQRRLHPLIEDPDNICNKMEVSPDTFLNFLHQNYPPFYGSMDDMQLAAEFLSAGDFILSGWKFDDSGTRSFKIRDAKEGLALNTAIRGLMYSNNNRISVGFKPLTKPQVSNLEKMTQESTESTRLALFELRELQTTLFTETIPIYAKLIQKNASIRIAEKQTILEKGLFKHKYSKTNVLGEKEVVDDDGSDDETQGKPNTSQVGNAKFAADLQPNNGNVSDEEEFIIEEFSD